MLSQEGVNDRNREKVINKKQNLNKIFINYLNRISRVRQMLGTEGKATQNQYLCRQTYRAIGVYQQLGGPGVSNTRDLLYFSSEECLHSKGSGAHM